MQFDFIRFLKQLPFSRLIFPLIGGILFALNFNVSIKLLGLISGILFLIFIFSVKFIFRSKNFKHRYIPGIFTNLLLFLLGIILLKVNEEENFRLYGKKVIVSAIIDEPLSKKENSYKSVLTSVTYKSDNRIVNESAKCIVYFEKDDNIANLKYGDKIIFKTRITKIKNPGNPHEFDYKQYLHRKGINGQVYLKSSDLRHIESDRGSFIFKNAYKARTFLSEIYEEYGILGKELSVLQALTLGDRSEIDDDTRQSYVAAGAMHILAVSGLHVGIIFMLFNFLLKFLDKVKYKDRYTGKILKAFILLIIIWCFAVLSGLSPSVRRAAVMFSFIIVSKAVNRHVNIYNSISASAFILLIINPYLITEVGFQLSYAAVLSIVFFQPKLVSLLKINNRILYYLWALTSVSIAAQIGTFPVTLYYFHIFPVLFFVSNIIVIPAATAILILAVLLLISSPLPYIPNAVAFILNNILKFLNSSVSFIEKIPYSTVENISFHSEDLISAYLFIILLTIFILLKKARALQLLLLTLIIWISVGSFRKIKYSNNNSLTIYNINNCIAVDIFGKQNLFLSDKKTIKSKSVIYGIQPNRQYFNKSDFKFVPVDTTKFISDNFIKRNNLIIAGDKTFLLLTDKYKTVPVSDSKLKADYVILGGNNGLSINTIANSIDFNAVILDSSNNFYELKQRKEECDKLKINYYSISEQGAFSTGL